MLSKTRSLTFAEIKSRLEKTTSHPTFNATKCETANGNYQNNVYGYGIINVNKAIK